MSRAGELDPLEQRVGEVGHRGVVELADQHRREHAAPHLQDGVGQAGDKLTLECRWNNAAGESPVFWGEGTGDEMCLGILYITGT